MTFKHQMILGFAFYIIALALVWLTADEMHIGNVVSVTVIFAGLWFIPRVMEYNANNRDQP